MFTNHLKVFIQANGKKRDIDGHAVQRRKKEINVNWALNIFPDFLVNHQKLRSQCLHKSIMLIFSSDITSKKEQRT